MTATVTAPAGTDRRGLAALATGHGMADLCQGAVPALLPFLIAERGLSLTAAAALITAGTLGSSIVQPVFGLWADRLSAPFLLPAGVAVGSVALGLTGICRSYAALAAVLLLGGLGIAAFHPEGARYANYVSGAVRGRGMSYFAVGGNVGFALGPALVTPLVGTFGLEATPLLALPGLAVSAWLVAALGRLRRAAPAAGPAASEAGPAGWSAGARGPFTRLVGAAVARTAAFFSLQAFVPVYLIRELGASHAVAGAALTGMLVAGAVGTLLGGRAADRFGRRRVIAWPMLPLIGLLALLPLASLPVFLAALLAIGLAVDAPFSTTVVLGQEYLPGRIALASGITYGLAIGVGGLAATAMGALADATSVRLVLALLPAFAALALGLALSLPRARG